MIDIVEDPANDAVVRWTGDSTWFVAGLPSGHEIDIDEPVPIGRNQGPRPTDLLLAAAASCSGISAVSLFKKMRQPVTGLNIRASGTRQPDWPKAFTDIMLDFDVKVGAGANDELIRKAVDLAVKRYCPVSATIELGAGGATVSYRVNIEAEREA